jgi:hypothetical protein
MAMGYQEQIQNLAQAHAGIITKKIQTLQG